MKSLFLTVLMIDFVVYALAQEEGKFRDYIKVTFENDKIKVTEYDSNPGKDVCGLGEHNHKAHLTVAFTDVKVKVTLPDGKTRDISVPSGSSFWSEAGTHIAVNSGKKPVKLLLIEPKE